MTFLQIIFSLLTSLQIQEITEKKEIIASNKYMVPDMYRAPFKAVYLLVHNNLQGKYYLHPHFTDAETEAQRNQSSQPEVVSL